MAYRFEPAKPEEVPGVFSLFVRRVAWMKEKRIRQWDQYYLDVYPLSYYQSQQEKGRLYVLKEKERIAGAVVLLSADDRWPDGQSASAFYLHNLVTDPYVKGVGRELLREAEALALRQQKRFLRATSVDSRSSVVGCIASEQIVGKIVFCVWPLDSFGATK